MEVHLLTCIFPKETYVNNILQSTYDASTKTMTTYWQGDRNKPLLATTFDNKCRYIKMITYDSTTGAISKTDTYKYVY